MLLTFPTGAPDPREKSVASRQSLISLGDATLTTIVDHAIIDCQIGSSIGVKALATLPRPELVGALRAYRRDLTFARGGLEMAKAFRRYLALLQPEERVTNAAIRYVRTAKATADEARVRLRCIKAALITKACEDPPRSPAAGGADDSSAA